MVKRYNLINIRTLLIEGFSDEELRDLCFDVADFKPVYHQLAHTTGKAELVRRLLAHAEQRLQVDQLLALAKTLNPARYAAHQPYFEDDSTPVRTGTSPASTPKTSSGIETNPTPTGTDDANSPLRKSSNPPSPPLRVFLCHASGDKPAVRDLYHRLRADGFEPWLDEEDLLPGQKWQREIPKAVRAADVVIVCLSHAALTKAGYVQEELEFALDIADQQPEETIFLIPVRLEECDTPNRLRGLHWVNLFEERGYTRLMLALQVRAEEKAKPRFLPRTHPFEPEMILIPAGEFLMGSDPKKDPDALDEEQPQHTLYLPDYYLAKTPVTNTQYAAFVQATGHHLPNHWDDKQAPQSKENHPVVNVSWADAIIYCSWLAEKTGKPYRLPSEAEWEKGARGNDGRIYPWGNQWDAKRCNSREGGKGGTTLVGAYPNGASPYGLLDMAGNVWEWCSTIWQDRAYPFQVQDEWSGAYLNRRNALRVLRGRAFDDDAHYVRCAARVKYFPYFKSYNFGLRVVLPPSI